MTTFSKYLGKPAIVAQVVGLLVFSSCIVASAHPARELTNDELLALGQLPDPLHEAKMEAEAFLLEKCGKHIEVSLASVSPNPRSKKKFSKAARKNVCKQKD